MKTLILILFPLFCFGQVKPKQSLSVSSLYDLGPKAGLSYVFESKGITFQANGYLGESWFLQAKMGATVNVGKSRFALYPFYLDLKTDEGYRTPIGIAWVKSWGGWTSSVGGDFDVFGNATVNLQLNRTMFGERYVPKQRHPIYASK